MSHSGPGPELPPSCADPLLNGHPTPAHPALRNLFNSEVWPWDPWQFVSHLPPPFGRGLPSASAESRGPAQPCPGWPSFPVQILPLPLRGLPSCQGPGGGLWLSPARTLSVSSCGEVVWSHRSQGQSVSTERRGWAVRSAPKVGGKEGRRTQVFPRSLQGRQVGQTIKGESPASMVRRLDALKTPPTKIQPDLG